MEGGGGGGVRAYVVTMAGVSEVRVATKVAIVSSSVCPRDYLGLFFVLKSELNGGVWEGRWRVTSCMFGDLLPHHPYIFLFRTSSS